MATNVPTVQGTLELTPDRSGRLRTAKSGYRAQPNDPIVSANVCKALNFRGGELVTAAPSSGSKRGVRVEQRDDVQEVNGLTPGEYLDLTPFEDLIAIDPRRPLNFETPRGPLSMRLVDLMTPIGLGQRGLIVAAPRTGKTVLLQQMAAGVATNHPDMYMMVLLIDERPEEVTEMSRTVRGEVVGSSNDHGIAAHVRIARLMIQKAKRMVEGGQDVLILLDSLTRLGRAFNASLQGSGRIMSGGLDIRALTEPKAIFGAARNVEDGGSLTIMASCLVETGSRMDDVIFNEFKGTGNMEIVLTRELADRRIWPAIDLQASGTRKEELLLTPEALAVASRIRRSVVDKDRVRAMGQVLELLGKHPDNARFVAEHALT